MTEMFSEALRKNTYIVQANETKVEIREIG